MVNIEPTLFSAYKIVFILIELGGLTSVPISLIEFITFPNWNSMKKWKRIDKIYFGIIFKCTGEQFKTSYDFRLLSSLNYRGC